MDALRKGTLIPIWSDRAATGGGLTRSSAATRIKTFSAAVEWICLRSEASPSAPKLHVNKHKTVVSRLFTSSVKSYRQKTPMMHQRVWSRRDVRVVNPVLHVIAYGRINERASERTSSSMISQYDRGETQVSYILFFNPSRTNELTTEFEHDFTSVSKLVYSADKAGR